MVMICNAFSDEYFKTLLKLRKNNILFFNGCFDIIHPGHIDLINKIKKSGKYYYNNDYVIVCGLNSDESVKKQNKSHPLINSEKERAEFLISLGIDNVFIFDDETPTALIMSLMPDKIYKGYDYLCKNFHEKEFCQRTKIQINYLDLLAGYSTTNAYNKIYDIAKKDITKKIME